MNHRPKYKMQTIKLLEDNTEENLGDLGFGDDFYVTMSKAQSMKKKLISWNLLKLEDSAIKEM